MFDANNPFYSANSSAFDFGDLWSMFSSVEKRNVNESNAPSDEYDWKNAYLILKDDFDSYRKRVENARKAEKSNLTKEIIRGFLDVVEFALFTYNAKNKIGTYTKEDEMILNKLSDFLKVYDVHPMKDPVGQTFDHRFHEAVLSDTSEMFESGTVTMVLSHGYMIGDEVLRYAKVAVAA
jgi:molecular chaperone GrpE